MGIEVNIEVSNMVMSETSYRRILKLIFKRQMVAVPAMFTFIIAVSLQFIEIGLPYSIIGLKTDFYWTSHLYITVGS